MTIPEFLDKLKATVGPWHVGADGEIRLGAHCPMTALCPERCTNAMAWDAAVVALGMDFEDAQTIVATADYEVGCEDYDIELRDQLLAATVQR